MTAMKLRCGMNILSTISQFVTQQFYVPEILGWKYKLMQSNTYFLSPLSDSMLWYDISLKSIADIFIPDL